MWVKDLRYAFRRLIEHRLFTGIAVLCLALGLGANSAIFSVVDAVLLKPLPFPEPERLVVFQDVLRPDSPERQLFDVSAVNFQAFSERSRSFTRLAAVRYGGFNLETAGEGEPERVVGARASAGFLEVLGMEPLLGRGFLPEEDQVGGAPVVLLSYDFWRRRFGGNEGIVGTLLSVEGLSHTVIGVLPEDLEAPGDPALWLPLAFDFNQVPQRTWHNLRVYGRLAPGVSLAAARSELAGLARQLAEEDPDTRSEWGAELIPWQDFLSQDVRTSLLVLLGAVGLVLLIACANVANLLLARNVGRRGEVALRFALGARRGQMLRQFLLESVLLSLLGAAVGLLFALLTLRFLLGASPLATAALEGVGLDVRVYLFTFLLALGTGLVFGLIPAFAGTRTELAPVLKEGGLRNPAGGKVGRLLGALVVAEIAVAVCLLLFAGLLIASLGRLGQVNPGFTPEGAVVLRMGLPEARYPGLAERDQFADAVLARVSQLPGVRAAAITNILPMDSARDPIVARFVVERLSESDAEEVMVAHHRLVSPGVLEALGVPLVQGRTLSTQDDADNPGVVVVSQEMARRLWPGQDPLGKRVRRASSAGDSGWLTVVGVAADVRDEGLQAEPAMAWYLPYAQQGLGASIALVVRAAGSPGTTSEAALVPTLRQAIWEVDPAQAIYQVETLSAMVAHSTSSRKFLTMLLVFFAALGLILAAAGIYGVTSYAVQQRHQEIGIRMALGADRGAILGLVLRRGAALLAIGLGVGLGVAFAVLYLWLLPRHGEIFYQVSGADPGVLAGVCLGLGTVALLANLLPARRATRVDPIRTLRAQ